MKEWQMARTFPTVFYNDLRLELSDNFSQAQDLGNEEFVMGDNYASVEQKPVNAQRQTAVWNWIDITIDQYEQLRTYFMGLGGDFILWTPEGQTEELKWRPRPGVLRGAFQGFDNSSLSIPVHQVFDHG